MTTTTTTVFIDETKIGSSARAKDARRMVEELIARGYDARYGAGHNGKMDADTQAQYDADFAALLEII